MFSWFRRKPEKKYLRVILFINGRRVIDILEPDLRTLLATGAMDERFYVGSTPINLIITEYRSV